jgi:hypothetical protein
LPVAVTLARLPPVLTVTPVRAMPPETAELPVIAPMSPIARNVPPAIPKELRLVVLDLPVMLAIPPTALSLPCAVPAAASKLAPFL